MEYSEDHGIVIRVRPSNILTDPDPATRGRTGCGDVLFISNVKYDSPIANDLASNGNTSSLVLVRTVDHRPYVPLLTVHCSA